MLGLPWMMETLWFSLSSQPLWGSRSLQTRRFWNDALVTKRAREGNPTTTIKRIHSFHAACGQGTELPRSKFTSGHEHLGAAHLLNQTTPHFPPLPTRNGQAFLVELLEELATWDAKHSPQCQASVYWLEPRKWELSQSSSFCLWLKQPQ